MEKLLISDGHVVTTFVPFPHEGDFVPMPSGNVSLQAVIRQVGFRPGHKTSEHFALSHVHIVLQAFSEIT